MGTASTSEGSEYRLHDRPVVRVAVSTLVVADSPRLAGEDLEHVRVLAESEERLPPIIVHRPTMRVIDGMHRLRAAVLRGKRDIEVQYFDGNDADAFVLAVRQNVEHGLPLSLADRKAAAERIIGTHPQWSNRVIATATGLAANTVRAMRRRLTGQNAQLDTRVGRDGKVRPLTTSEGRIRASVMMTEDPTMSLREVAKAASISPETARDVRQRLRRGDDPVPAKQRTGDRWGELDASRRADQARRRTSIAASPRETGAILEDLRRDPSIRFTQSGRTLLRLLAAHEMEATKLVDEIPVHCADKVARLAHLYARNWQDIARLIEGNRRT